MPKTLRARAAEEFHTTIGGLLVLQDSGPQPHPLSDHSEVAWSYSPLSTLDPRDQKSFRIRIELVDQDVAAIRNIRSKETLFQLEFEFHFQLFELFRTDGLRVPFG